MFKFSVVVVDLPTDSILSFLFAAETDVLVPVFSQSTDVVVVNFVVVLKFPITRFSGLATFIKARFQNDNKRPRCIKVDNGLLTRAIIGQRGTLPVMPLGYLNPQKVIFRTMRTMRKQFPVTWLTSGRFSAKARPGQ